MGEVMTEVFCGLLATLSVAVPFGIWYVGLLA